MNWRRILSFTALLLVATFLAAAPFEIIGGFLRAQHKPVPTWVPLGLGVAVPFAAFLVFAILAYRQRTGPATHAALVWLLGGLLLLPLNVGIFGQPVQTWFFGTLFMGGLMLLGVGIGIAFQPLPAESA